MDLTSGGKKKKKINKPLIAINLRMAQLFLPVRYVSYNEWLLVDVMQVQREDIIFAAHVHAIVVLVHEQDPIVGGVQQKGEVVSGAGGF